MRILRLELFGFKSFKDKTIVTFEQAITAIVGSNGCGKSNVVDALYWVMGDMSPKHLRGHQMTDVIFSGSRDAPAMDMAEVTLVLERNPASDPPLPPQFQASNEIQITRRYYRNGESEYFMNRTICRLRDIQEFFLDSGCGAKGYSIIEQGAITRMVAQKPEERRVVIEEVAGILKFKARKAETERKIEGAKLNLQRVDDIVKDLQRQLNSLKRQAEKAEKVRNLSEELKRLEIRIASREWIERQDSRAQSLLVTADLRNNIGQLEEKLLAERDRLEGTQARLTTLEEELSGRREITRSAELAIKDIESEIAQLGTRAESSRQREQADFDSLQQLAERDVTLEEQLKQLAAVIDEMNAKASEVARSTESASTALEALREKAQGLREELDAARKRLHEEELEQTRLTQQIQNLQRTIGQLGSKQESLRLQLGNVETELEQRAAERAVTQGSLDQAFSTRDDLEKRRNSLQEELNRLENARGEGLTSLNAVKQDLTQVRVRREHLEALDQNLEGVDAAARALALHKRQQGENHALLADDVKVPALLEKAVEAVLGRNLQRVSVGGFGDIERVSKVISDSGEAEARAGRIPLWIPSLNERNAPVDGLNLASVFVSAGPLQPVEVPGPDGLVGRVDLVPSLKTATDYLLEHPDVIGPLTDLILNENAGAEGPWLNLLRHFWVLRSRESLSEVAQALAGLPLNFVSLEGDVLTHQGFLDLAPVEAAAGDAAVGLVQRRRQIDELRAQEQDLDAKNLLSQEALDRCVRDLQNTKEAYRELAAQLAALNPDVERYTSFLRTVEAQLARLHEKKDLLSADLQRAVLEERDCSSKLEEIAAQVASGEERKKEQQSAVDGIRERLESLVAEQKTGEARLADLTRESKSLDKTLADRQSERAAAEHEKTLSAARRSQIEGEIETLKGQLAALEEQQQQAAGVRQTCEQKLEEAVESERELDRAVDAQKKLAREAQSEVEKIAREVQTLDGRLRDIDQSLAVNDVELRNLSERLSQQYQIALESLDALQLKELSTPLDTEEVADPEASKTRVQQLRTRIDNLGKVNMVAVEEFEEVSKRHEYLFIQRQDLNDSISQLQEAIDRINRESRERFAEAFNAVNASFQQTFPVLFGGGNAELRLTNPDDLLETGVEIVAQPPGKKLVSVTLLSGGEKALTAVSLIFGIFLIKPSPFAVLDEVDAPLDDANVERFCTQVRRMAERSQIIMITHHKKTMERADALFGVTMEKPGISKLASAKLGELKV